jgi:hypothetical protein
VGLKKMLGDIATLAEPYPEASQGETSGIGPPNLHMSVLDAVKRTMKAIKHERAEMSWVEQSGRPKDRELES